VFVLDTLFEPSPIFPGKKRANPSGKLVCLSVANIFRLVY